MSVDLLKICDPLAYYSQFLFESVYPDGRSIGSFRPISLQMGVTQSAAGSCVSRQGGAMVTARIEPFLAVRSDDSIIVPHIDAAPVIPQRVVEDAEVLLRQLIEEEAFFKRDQLVTANGRLMWILHLHIAILNVDGCLLDTLVTCATGAFLDLQLPRVNVDLDEDITVDINEALLSEHSEHISLADLPVLSTFIVLDAHTPNKVGH
uniref:Ribosomal RNA-processing protein 43 n=1 Tax=Parascaris univalens TaxID=6257 RepID=A0A915AKS4_PARUN